ncbi:MAG: VacJ family lipoprotein, partial [Planctomycetes bacterium]|nr:VacJ family lipoprotein [Planctomycetota bacterium]
MSQVRGVTRTVSRRRQRSTDPQPRTDRRRVRLLLAAGLSVLCGTAPAAAQSVPPPPAAADDSAAPALVTGTARPLDGAAFAGAETATGPAAASAQPVAEDTSLGALEAEEAELAEYDPWAPFNEKTFAFNHGLDRHVIKPVAKAYDKVVPNIVQRAVRNIFENVGSIRRIVNTALQGRFNDTGQELGRFVINTVFGLGGFIDAAPSFGVAPRADADTGQTFG